MGATEAGDAVIFWRSDISVVESVVSGLHSDPSTGRQRSSIKTPLPKIHHQQLPTAKTECFYFPQDHKYTQYLLNINFLLVHLLKNNSDFYFPPDSGPPLPPPQVGGRLMKGWSRRNMGETYRRASQPSRHEASDEKILLPHHQRAFLSLRHIRCRLTPQPVRDIIVAVLSIFSPLPLAQSLPSKSPSMEPFVPIVPIHLHFLLPISPYFPHTKPI